MAHFSQQVSMTRNIKRQLPGLAALLSLILMQTLACANEIIFIPPPESKADKRYDYSEKLLKKVLEKTEAQYGKAEIVYSVPMQRDRILLELKKGELIQVADVPSRPDFEQLLLPVRIPINKGILGYRLLLIDKKNQEKFTKITRVEELKKLRAGLGKQWSITPVFIKNNFLVTQEVKYESLFRLLTIGESDYFPRGVNEIFDEYEARKAAMPSLHIEETLILYLPLPTYFFVSPGKPVLAERITLGLEAMIRDGSFEAIFLEYHRDFLQKMNLPGRKIFRIDNPNLPPETPFNRPEFWLEKK